jgi:hypothetical protein
MYNKIISLYSELTNSDFGPFGTIKLENAGNGDYIAKWEHPTLAQPTAEQLK